MACFSIQKSTESSKNNTQPPNALCGGGGGVRFARFAEVPKGAPKRPWSSWKRWASDVDERWAWLETFFWWLLGKELFFFFFLGGGEVWDRDVGGDVSDFSKQKTHSVVLFFGVLNVSRWVVVFFVAFVWLYLQNPAEEISASGWFPRGFPSQKKISAELGKIRAMKGISVVFRNFRGTPTYEGLHDVPWVLSKYCWASDWSFKNPPSAATTLMIVVLDRPASSRLHAPKHL